MALEITTEQAADDASTVILALAGEVDASNFTELVDAGQRLRDTGISEVVLDLANLTFLASSGLVALYSLVRIMRGDAPPDPEEGWSALHSIGLDPADVAGHLRLCCTQPAVDRVLERTGLKRLFVVYPDRSTALAAG